MLSEDQVAELLEVNHEVRVAEFKSAGSPNDKEFLAKVARACLAMANQRNGGHLLIGVDDEDPTQGPSGLSDDEVAAWLEFDKISAKINSYADPPLALEIAERKHPSGARLVVIEVGEFGDSPVLCKKDFGRILSCGQLYTRSLSKPESSQYYSQAELREVIDIAIEKGLRAFVSRARNAGIELGPGDAERYDERFSSFNGDADVQKMHAGMYFDMRFRPIPFELTRIAFEDLESTMQGVQIRRPSMTFPIMGYEFENSQHAITWRRSGQLPTLWRLDQSGGFALTRLLRDPGPDFDGHVDRNDPGVNGFISIFDIVAFVTVALELSVRMMNALGIDDAECEIVLGGIQGIALVVGDSRRSGLFGSYVYHDDSWFDTVELAAEDRGGDPAGRAAKISREIFLRFGWRAVTPELVVGIQESLRGKQ